MVSAACNNLHLRYLAWCLLRALTLEEVFLQRSRSDAFFVSVVVVSVVLAELLHLFVALLPLPR